MQYVFLFLSFLCLLSLSAQETIEPPVCVEELTPLTHKDSVQVGDIADVSAEFPGGTKKLMQYISDNIIYPQETGGFAVQGRVYVSFVIEADGSISNVKVLRGIYQYHDKEAKRVVKNMPKWKPAQNGGKIVRSRSALPINFRL